MSTAPRTPLSKERVLRAAIAFADEHGIEELSMRKLARELGVEAMSLYKHVANKDAILAGILDLVASEIELPEGPDWRTAHLEPPDGQGGFELGLDLLLDGFERAT
jgi:AcrR family transcriptional regulator